MRVFFSHILPFFVSLKYLSLLVLRSNKSCVSREGNANTDGRIRVGGVARFELGVLLFLESLSVCVSLSVSRIRLRFRGNDEMMRKT